MVVSPEFPTKEPRGGLLFCGGGRADEGDESAAPESEDDEEDEEDEEEVDVKIYRLMSRTAKGLKGKVGEEEEEEEEEAAFRNRLGRRNDDEEVRTASPGDLLSSLCRT